MRARAITTLSAVPSADEAWVAVLGRDPAFDGRFVYAVSSTGIYCRPTCPSRRPRRDRVSFFSAADKAEGAGYRACLRCDPRGERVDTPPAAVSRAREYLEARFDEPITLQRLGREAGMSASHLQRTFMRAYGMSPRQYQASLRLQRFKRELRNGANVTTATYEAGYGSASRVYENSQLGMPPGVYRKGGRGMAIRFATAGSPLGRLLVAATERGLCAVALDDDDARLEARLKAEYPLARVERVQGELKAWLDAIVRSLAGDKGLESIPTDARGTAFQHRVWNALRAIPRGETRTYGEVAALIGQPSAARAVARACATNPIALVVPCHRVVPRGGEVGGYRWGAARKEALLAGEARSRAKG